MVLMESVSKVTVLWLHWQPYTSDWVNHSINCAVRWLDSWGSLAAGEYSIISLNMVYLTRLRLLGQQGVGMLGVRPERVLAL